jgi:mono/diheme cytochrome c family protein
MAKRIRILMGVVLSLMLFLVANCNPNPQPAGLTPIPTLVPGGSVTLVPELQGVQEVAGQFVPGQADAAIGAPLYQRHCTTCHGIQGQGVDAPPLRNSQYVQTGGDQSVFATVAEGRLGTEMPAWLRANGGPLIDVQISSVVAYLRTLQGLQALPTATPMPPEPTETPPPPGAPTPEPARPSEPGEPGPAASMTGDVGEGRADFGLYCAACHGPEGAEEVGIPNPGSEDGIVPELNPIDPTIANPDPKVFAANVDLFIEHGSVPEGSSPRILMPPFGDSQMLTDQQIANLIAYLMDLNGAKETE